MPFFSYFVSMAPHTIMYNCITDSYFFFKLTRYTHFSFFKYRFPLKISDCVGPDGSPKQVRTVSWHTYTLCVCVYCACAVWLKQFAFLPSARWDVDQRLQHLWMWQWFHECPLSARSVPHAAKSHLHRAWTKAGQPDRRLLHKPVVRSVTVPQTLITLIALSSVSRPFSPWKRVRTCITLQCGRCHKSKTEGEKTVQVAVNFDKG